MTSPVEPKDYEKFVVECFRRIGYLVELPKNPNQEAWDFAVLAPNGKRGAVQVKSRKQSLSQPQYNSLSLYITGPAGVGFDFGINVVNSSFSKPTLLWLENNKPEEAEKYVYGARVEFPKGIVEWQVREPYADMPIEPAPKPISITPPPPAYRVAVFTEKGGVGKTSLAAHLAGALLYQDRDAVLVDCDPQKNLSLLLGEGINVRNQRGKVSTLVVERLETFDQSDYPNYFTVFDCAPHFNSNNPNIFKLVTDTIVPIVLSPLSILGNAAVIGRTIEAIRSVNRSMRFHVIINQFEQNAASVKYQTDMLNFVRYGLKQAKLLNDPLVRFYMPNDLSIRRSNNLLHWGMFLLRSGEDPHLAFATGRAGAANLQSDFLALAQQIELAIEGAVEEGINFGGDNPNNLARPDLASLQASMKKMVNNGAQDRRPLASWQRA